MLNKKATLGRSGGGTADSMCAECSKSLPASQAKRTLKPLCQVSYEVRQFDTSSPKYFRLYVDFRGVCYLYPCYGVTI